MKSQVLTVLVQFYFLFMLLGHQNAVGQSTNQLIFDGNQSQYFGAENIITLQKMICQMEDRVLPIRFSDESTFGQKVAGIGYRGAKILAIDLPVDYLSFLVQHEVFGHGSRYREVGYKDFYVELNLPFPYGPGRGFIRASGLGESVTSQTEDLMSIAGGMEGTLLLAHQLEYRWLQDDAMHYRQSFLYLISRNDIVAYIWRDRLFSNERFVGGDPANWLIDINVLYAFKEENIGKWYTHDRIEKQSLIALANPFQWYAAYTVAKTYLVDGDTHLEQMPTIHIGKLEFLPALGFNLTPFGSEFILNQYIIGKRRLTDVQVSVGDPYFNKFYAASVNVHDLVKSEKYSVGLHIGAWEQPPALLGGERVEESSGGLGGFGKAQLAYFPLQNHANLGLYASVGYKTTGYLMGEQLDKGAIYRFGLAFRMAGE